MRRRILAIVAAFALTAVPVACGDSPEDELEEAADERQDALEDIDDAREDLREATDDRQEVREDLGLDTTWTTTN